jgi:hypothetical protein
MQRVTPRQRARLEDITRGAADGQKDMDIAADLIFQLIAKVGPARYRSLRYVMPVT